MTDKPSVLRVAGEPVAYLGVPRFAVYTEAQLLSMYAAGAESAKSEGWRQCAVGQHTSQFCGQLEAEKAKAYAAGEEGMRERAVNILRNRISAVMAADEIAALPITPATGEQA